MEREDEDDHPGGDPGANLKSIAHRCHPILVAFAWELSNDTINLPLVYLHRGGEYRFQLFFNGRRRKRTYRYIYT